MCLREIQISEYIEELSKRGGKAHSIIQKAPSDIPPLKLICATKDYLYDEQDARVIAGALDSPRQIPEAVFEAPSINVFTSGLPVLDHYVTGRITRSKKFFKKINPTQEDLSTIELAHLNRQDNNLPALLLGPIEEFNYSHWILEALPKIKLFTLAYGHPPKDVIVWGKKIAYQGDSIGTVSPDTKIHHVGHRIFKAKNIAYTTSVARSVAEINSFVPKFLRELTDRHKYQQRKRLYITRKNATHRKILNETELIELLDSFNFVVIDPGSYRFQEQVELFSNAEIVVSPHGAGLTNIVFSQNLSLLVEIFCSGFQDQSAYAHLARHLNSAYCPISFPPAVNHHTRSNNPETWPGHGSFYVDLKIIKKFLNNVL